MVIIGKFTRGSYKTVKYESVLEKMKYSAKTSYLLNETEFGNGSGWCLKNKGNYTNNYKTLSSKIF